MRVKVLLIGPPGSGKGTQGERLAERLGLAHIAAGDLLREEVRNATALGTQVSDMLRRGDLVPDAIVLGLVLPRVLEAAAGEGYLLDGFPRSVEQAVEARKLAEQVDATPDVVLYLEAPPDVLMRRILERAKQLGRDDDNEETVTKRLKVFDEATRPLIDYYRDRGLLRVIDAAPEVDEVTETIMGVLAEVRDSSG